MDEEKIVYKVNLQAIVEIYIHMYVCITDFLAILAWKGKINFL